MLELFIIDNVNMLIEGKRAGEYKIIELLEKGYLISWGWLYDK